MNTRLCKSCQTLFPSSSEFFYETTSSKGKVYLRTTCKKCMSDTATLRQKEARKSNPELVRLKERESRNELRSWIDQFKLNAPCTDCGRVYPPVCMDFDHLPEFSKVADISVARARKWSKERILEEISKCELVCSNCHRIRGQKRREAFANSVREEVDLFEELRAEILSARILFSEGDENE